MKLTENFTLEELTVSSISGDNTPSEIQIEALRQLAINVLQPLREIFGSPIRINSGFRSQVINKKVGGSPSSQHCKGEAADLSCSDNAAIFRIIYNELPFDQIIWEAGDDNKPDWIHVSYKSNGPNRKEALRMTKLNGKSIYSKMVL